MKKILIITNHSYMFWQFRKELVEELQKHFEIAISTPLVGHEEDLAAIGCKIIPTDVQRRSVNPMTDLRLFCTYMNMLRKEQPDMVITYSIKPNVYAGCACQILKIPYCINVQGLGTAFQKKKMAYLVSLLYKIACRKAKTVFFENEENALLFRSKKITFAEQQTMLAGAGVNLQHYEYVALKKSETVHFLYLGRIMKEKGMDELFQAIRELHAEYGSRVVLDLVGFFEDSYKDEVEQLISEGIVNFYGFQEDPRPFYEKADCIVLPSYHEGMSNVLLEAAACGRMLVTSDISGCREAVEPGKTGLLCEVKDAGSLFDAMKQVINLTPEEREAAGKLGRKKMEREFDRKKVVDLTVSQIMK